MELLQCDGGRDIIAVCHILYMLSAWGGATVERAPGFARGPIDNVLATQ